MAGRAGSCAPPTAPTSFARGLEAGRREDGRHEATSVACRPPAPRRSLAAAARRVDDARDDPRDRSTVLRFAGRATRQLRPRPLLCRAAASRPAAELVEYPVTAGSHPHDVAPAADGGVWYTGQRNGTLGHLDPATGEVREIDLGAGSAPHGVIVGPDGAPWITDGGLNAIVRVDPATEEVEVFELPGTPSGREPQYRRVRRRRRALVHRAVRDVRAAGPEDGARSRRSTRHAAAGRTGSRRRPIGEVWYASLAGSHIAHIDRASGEATVVEPPTAGQGARRIWSDSSGRLWVAEWNAGQVGVHDPADGSWQEWPLPGDGAQAYAVYVDDLDRVWLTDFTANAIVRFDPSTETFESFALPDADAAVRQLLGRPGEVWGAESGLDRLVVIRER